MGADQFLLTWNNHRSNFAEVFSQLRVQDQLVDVTLLCDGGSYPAHRLVLAACSPYFHQLFTRLPTQHPIVYLRDVRQAELEALLEFIYRGEVSVANSELTGLIKIAESLRIKGLGDVSQRDPAPFSKPEKRSASTYCTSSPSSGGRPRKAPRLATAVSSIETKSPEGELPSILSPNFGLRPSSLSHLLENPALASQGAGDIDSQDPDLSTSPHKESKLRSCLEGQEQIGLPFSNLLAQPAASRIVGGLLRREMENREALEKEKKKISKGKGRQLQGESFSSETDKEEKILFNDIKQETLSGEDPSSPIHSDQDALLLPPLSKLYDPGDFSNSFLTKYTQLLSSFHQQQQQQQQPQISHLNHLEREEEPQSFPSLIPTTVQEHPIPISPKDAKSLTCNLCGATIKHIANFRRHMKQHLNPRRFPCPWCSAAFGRKDNLKTHTRKHHPTEVEAQEQNISTSVSMNDGDNGHSRDRNIEGEHPDDGDEGAEEDGHVFNGIGGETSSPINEDDDSGDQNGEDDSLIIVDEGEEDDEEEEEDGEEKSHEAADAKDDDEKVIDGKENGKS